MLPNEVTYLMLYTYPSFGLLVNKAVNTYVLLEVQDLVEKDRF